MSKKRGLKSSITVLDEACELSSQAFDKLQEQFNAIDYSKIACIEIKNFKHGNPFNNEQGYVFVQNNIVVGVGNFIGKNRMNGQFMFQFDDYLPDGQYDIIVTSREKYTIIKENQEFYYLWNGGYVGNAMLWWRKGGSGYTTNIEEAHKFTKAQAMEYHKARKTDIPYLCAHVDSKAIKIADAQHISKEYSLGDH